MNDKPADNREETAIVCDQCIAFVAPFRYSYRDGGRWHINARLCFDCWREQRPEEAEAARLALAATEPAEPRKTISPGEALYMELELRRAQMSRFPFCPDHRDKVRGLSCRQCEIERLLAEQSRSASSLTEPENKRLRRMLCLARSSHPYMDDGEAQDNSVHPSIDYLRDSLDEIDRKWVERNRAATEIRAAPSEPDDYARFTAWAYPFTWAQDKAAMDLAWLAYRAALRPSAVLEAAPAYGELLSMAKWCEEEFRFNSNPSGQLHGLLLRAAAALRASTPSPSPTGEKP